MSDRWREHPSVRRLVQLARALGPLTERVVFIGEAIAPILQIDPPFASARVTKDVGGVAATISYGDAAELGDALRTRGFREAALERHPHRWIAPDGNRFDLVPAGDYLGASGQNWDEVAIATARRTGLEPDIAVRHASAPAFLALTWAAFADRGAGDPFASYDIEDILALLASRRTIVEDVAASPESVREFLRERFAWLATHRDFDDLLAATLGNAFSPAEVIGSTRARIVRLSAINYPLS